jgi:hypothetical protein
LLAAAKTQKSTLQKEVMQDVLVLESTQNLSAASTKWRFQEEGGRGLDGDQHIAA